MKTIIKRVCITEYITPSIMAGFQSVWDGSSEPPNDMIRISEWIEVEFPCRDESEILPEIVAGIDSEIESIKEKAMAEISILQTRKSELLALKHE